MKRLLALFLASLASLLLLILSACNYQIIDTTYTFDKAIISMPDGSILTGDVVSWKDYGDGDQIQVKIGNSTYLVHSSNVVLIKE